MQDGGGPQFSAHFYCDQTAGCIKVPLGMEVGLNPRDFVLDGDPAPPPLKGHRPQFSAYVRCGQTPDGLRWHLVWRQASAQATLYWYCHG